MFFLYNLNDLTLHMDNLTYIIKIRINSVVLNRLLSCSCHVFGAPQEDSVIIKAVHDFMCNKRISPKMSHQSR